MFEIKKELKPVAYSEIKQKTTLKQPKTVLSLFQPH